MSQQNPSSFIRSVADLLRGDHKPSEYGRVILPFAVSRRLDRVLERTKAAVQAEKAKRDGAGAHPIVKPISRIFKQTDFGYHTITVERPERDAKGNVVKETKGKRKVREKEKAHLSEIIEQLSTILGSDTTDGDRLSFINTLGEKTLES
jgi:type I restriction-modification system DNA methylase subunit